MALRRLSELDDWEVADSDEDIRGSQLRDRDRNALGTIKDMLVDTDQKLVQALILEDGEQIAADDIDIEDDGVFLKQHGRRTSTQGVSQPKVRIYGSGDQPRTRPSL